MRKILKNNIDRVQLLLTLLVWMLIFAIPLLFGKFEDGINWEHIFKIWKEYALLIVIFVVNRFLLMPKLFFKGRRIQYFTSITVLIVMFSMMLVFAQHYIYPAPEREGPPPRPHFEMESIIGSEPGGRPPHGKKGGPREEIPPYANLVIMSVLLIGFDSGLLFFSKWMQSEQNKLKAEKDNVEAQLGMLKNQVSPHFFMNTLNNIHALIEYDTEGAKDAVIRLSKLMRYLLYESEQGEVSLRKEIEFLKNYIELMKIRFAHTVKISFDILNDIPDKSIPPLLFTSFVENAFKHGISYKEESFVQIIFSTTESSVKFTVENSNHSKQNGSDEGGIGIANAQKRLDILYGTRYKLEIVENNDIYKVKLEIPL